MILRTFSWKLRRAAECLSGHVGKWYNLAVFSGVIQNPHGAEVLRQAGCENFLTMVFSSPSGIKRAPGDLNCTPFVEQYGIDKQKLIDVLDARATRSKSFNADIIALHNGSVLFVRRYKKRAAPRQWAEVRLEKRKHEFPHCQYMQFPKKSQEGCCDER